MDVTITGKQFFKQYRETGGKLSKHKHSIVLSAINSEICSELLQGNDVRITYFGRMMVAKRKLITRLLVAPSGVKHLNCVNFDGFSPKLIWNKRGSRLFGKRAYSFRLSWTNKNILRELFRDQDGHSSFVQVIR